MSREQCTTEHLLPVGMEEPKKQKIDSESKAFKEQWTNLYFFIKHENRPTCLICKETVTTFKEHNIKYHYETKHKKKYGVILGPFRDEKILKLRRDIDPSIRTSHKRRHETEAVLKASYRIAHILSRELRPFSDGECVKKCMMAAMEEMFPEKKNAFKTISLSSMTITKRVEDLGKNLQSKLRSKAACFEMFSIAADVSPDVYDNIQLLVFIRGTSSSFEITEELAGMRCIRGLATAEDLFSEVETIINNLGLTWDKLVGVTTNGDKNMVGCYNGLAARVSRKVIQSNGTQPLQIHCIIHQQDLCNKSLDLSHVIKIVINIVRYITTQALNHKIFQDFIVNMESDYKDLILSESEVYWLTQVKVFKRFFELRHDIDTFMTEKSRPVAQLKDPAWIWDLAVFCDIMTHLNELTNKLQERDKLISDLYADVMAFQAKLQLFIQQATKSSLVHFPTCAALRHDEKLSSFFPKSRIVQLLVLLKDNFTERFIEFGSIKNAIRLFENPFAVDVSTAPTDLQLELIDLQSQTSLLDKFRTLHPIEFYALLPIESFPKLRKVALKLTTMFTSTRVCEEAFLMMKRSKYVGPNGLTNDHLDSVLRIGVSSMEPDIKKLVSKKTSKHSTVIHKRKQNLVDDGRRTVP